MYHYVTLPNEKPIGIFDSGIGGLTVASALHKLMPGEDILYLGDTARVPYGVKSVATIQRYALESSLFLLNRGVKMIVVACNTVSAVALPRLQELLRTPIVGVLEPGVSEGLNTVRNGRIGVIGTPSTIFSNAYQNKLKEISPELKVFSKDCPLFVPLAEEGKCDGTIVEMIIDEYLADMKAQDIGSLILGCTHYPLFKTALNRYFERKVHLVDSADAVSLTVQDILLRESLIRTHGEGVVHCYVTDVPRRFPVLAELFFGGALKSVQKVNLNDSGN